MKKPFARYLVVGGSVYVFEMAIIVLAQDLGATAVVAVAISFFLGLIAAFILQKFITFGDKRTHHKVLLPQILAVIGLVIFNFCFTITLTKIFSNNVPAAVIRTIAIAITTLWNFYLYKTHIFKNVNEFL